MKIFTWKNDTENVKLENDFFNHTTKPPFIYEKTPALEMRAEENVWLSAYKVYRPFIPLSEKEDWVSLGYRSMALQKTKYNNLDFFPYFFLSSPQVNAETFGLGM